MPIFSVVDMDENAIAAAYPLVRTVAPEVSAEQWSDYARKLYGAGGLLGLTGADGALFGFFSYRKGDTLRYGCVLHIDIFVTFELNRAAPGRRALCEAAETLARKQGCAAIEIRLDSRGFADSGSAKSQGWLSLGHRLEAVVFTKLLEAGIEADTAAPILSAAVA